MTFNGTWKVDRNDNYDKFMEQMGECRRGLFLRPSGSDSPGVSARNPCHVFAGDLTLGVLRPGAVTC